ncbi:MAG TPA: CDP-diacylglycerol--serine O-phosphatidyltransferase [Ignavibacteriaceae bacterium]|nr:CDP-diacylglycerol--serine O-phosphatidyltransferase [Ignavibacteriaceae bacterium]
MKSPRNTSSVIPNLFTAMNLFCGYYSIINTSEKSYVYAAWLIIIAAVFDALDGLVARLTNSSSKLGVELDSLADMLSFGAAPAFLIFKTFLFNYNTLGIIISSLLVIAGGFRLARFNTQLVGFDKAYFKGLPIPSSGIAIASFILIYYDPFLGFAEPYSALIIPIVILLSFLMVSTIKYDTLPKFTIQELKKKPLHFAFILISIILLAVTSGKALFFIFVFIILFGIFRHIFYMFSKKN